MVLFRRLFQGILLALLVITVLMASSLARDSYSGRQSQQSSMDIDFQTWIDINEILMFVSNQGSLAYDHGVYFGRSDGFYYPFTSIADINSGTNDLTAIYAGSLWMSGVDSSSGDTIVTSGAYHLDWGVGPIAGDTCVPGAEVLPAYRVYKLYQDSLAGNPNQDYIDWPAGDGAPLDRDGNPLMHGHQMLWTVFNDLNAPQHTGNCGTPGLGLGVEVHLTVWAYNPGHSLGSGQTLYLKFKFINKGGKTLQNCIPSIWFDPDLGDAGDDLVGCDTLDNIFFCYNANATDARYGSQPPAIGAKVLQGPIVPSPGGTAYVDNTPVPDYRNLGMESYAGLLNPFDPDDFRESYRVMSGLDLGGSPFPNGTRYFGPGDPVTGTGDLDTVAGDRRMMANVGPFTFRPGDTQQVVIRLAAATGADHLSSVTDLRNVLNLSFSIPTGIDDPPGSSALPSGYNLAQNYPNPFNPATVIEYSLPTRSDVTISIFNILGQEVRKLVNASMAVGDHTAYWNGTDQSGDRVASGVYFYRIKANDFVSSKKMLLLK